MEFGCFQYSGLPLRTRVPFSGFSRLKTAGVQVSPGYGCFSSFPRFLNQMIDSFIYYTVQQNICHVRHMKANKTFLNPFWSLISNFGSKISYHLNFAFFRVFLVNSAVFVFFENKIEGNNFLHVLLFKMKVCIITMILKKEKLKKSYKLCFWGSFKVQNSSILKLFWIFFFTKIFF